MKHGKIFELCHNLILGLPGIREVRDSPPCRCHLAIVCGLWLVSMGSVAWSADGYQREVMVQGPTRLDWVFALSNQSPADAPAEWIADYDSTKQKYELFVPPKARTAAKGKSGKSVAGEGIPLILFISPGDEPTGWEQFQAICRQRGMAFASPFGAGNNIPTPRRVHLILDVLDDIRKQHTIDPDRTYIGGFSGGGRIACALGFALPELFGGILPVCAVGDLREETWLRHRVIERISVGLVTGSGDFNNGEVARFRGPMLLSVGVRTQVTIVPQMGHAVPDSKVLGKTLDWLEAGIAERRKRAAQYPASRSVPDGAPSREEAAKALLSEGQTRLKNPKTLYSGLMQLQGVMQRWPDLEEAAEAKRILSEYDSRTERPWEAEDIAEQRKFLVARARGLGAYATGGLPDEYSKQRPDMLKAAINLWTMVVEDGQDAKAVAEAEKQLLLLQKRLDAE